MYNKFLGFKKRGVVAGVSQFLIKKQNYNYGCLVKINSIQNPFNSSSLQNYKTILQFERKQHSGFIMQQSNMLKTQQFNFSQKNDGKNTQKQSKEDSSIKNKKEQKDYDYGTAKKENKIRKGMTEKEQKSTKDQRKGYGDMNEQIFDIQKDKKPKK